MIADAPRTICLLLATGLISSLSSASEVADQNPFDPGRKPWKEEKEVPTLPELTPKDLQIDAIISFGQFRGIVAQLDGRLKGYLPANAAGKVRIQVGQNFGGYELAAIEPNLVVVKAGNKRFNIPLLRKVSKGGPPAPATQVPEPSPATPMQAPKPPLPAPATTQPLPGTMPSAAAVTDQATAVTTAPIAPPPPEQAAGLSGTEPAVQAVQAAQPPAGSNAFLEALQQAAKARPAAGAAAPAQGLPFFGKP